ncbi:hypothetical protein BY996DRAFT_4579091 [Phakopsora pachyrhizi]|nr:hypothetical protein BY996DRAFT_4579091 [Phakopsora pachyrhizi]
MHSSSRSTNSHSNSQAQYEDSPFKPSTTTSSVFQNVFKASDDDVTPIIEDNFSQCPNDGEAVRIAHQPVKKSSSSGINRKDTISQATSVPALPGHGRVPTLNNYISEAASRFVTSDNLVSTSGASHITHSSYRKSLNYSTYITSRFEHMDTDEGFVVLTGRKGEASKCEDEPIRVPGAIQAFGVLIAVQVHGEMEDLLSITRLEVVQVSENSGHILGLSPGLLLNLHSLSEIFTEPEAQVLCDNIEVCMDSTSTSEAGPHTFRLTGRGEVGSGTNGRTARQEWTAWCAAHRPEPVSRPRLVIIEFELEGDEINPTLTSSVEPLTEEERGGMAGKPYEPTEEDVVESTRSVIRPLRALSRLRKKGKDFSGDSVEVLSILGQVNNQFDKAQDMPSFVKMVVGLVRELTGFHRVMIYQFDENWNGQVVAELVDWKRTRDLYRGLKFPASDIPAQARELYKINKVRMLYDRDQPTARLVCKTKYEVKRPLDMTHCHLRAMSPIHIQYLANMGVRASFSISILMNNELWGLISCHSYGRYGQRITFPTRHFCRMLGECVSRNIYRLHLSQRLQSRKLINTVSTSKNPSGYIVAKAEDLLWIFDAEFGVLSIGEEAKLLGPVSNSQEILAVLEYLRIKCFDTIQASTDIKKSFPDIIYSAGFESICGILVIPLSRGGQDFICFFRPGQMKDIHWAGNPHEKILNENNPRSLEPRKSFKIWSEASLNYFSNFPTVKGRAKNWTDEQLETGSVLSLVYGKFIDVWRQKEAAVHTNQLQTLLLSNASHEVRTPLHQILSTLELALDGQLDDETRDNLSKSYSASKALVHVINDLLDLTKAEQGGDLFSRDPFNLSSTIEEAVLIHKREAQRKGLQFEVVEDPADAPAVLRGDRARLRQVISNLVCNAVKHTSHGYVHVKWGEDRSELGNLRLYDDTIRISISVTDTGKGIPQAKLESIFRAFEQVGAGESEDGSQIESIGLGLAVVGRVVHNMGGQLRVDSTVDKGSKFTLVLPFSLPGRASGSVTSNFPSEDSGGVRINFSDESYGTNRGDAMIRSNQGSNTSNNAGSICSSSEIDGFVEAMQRSGTVSRLNSEPSTSPRVFNPLNFPKNRVRGGFSSSSYEEQSSSLASPTFKNQLGGQGEPWAGNNLLSPSSKESPLVSDEFYRPKSSPSSENHEKRKAPFFSPKSPSPTRDLKVSSSSPPDSKMSVVAPEPLDSHKNASLISRQQDKSSNEIVHSPRKSLSSQRSSKRSSDEHKVSINSSSSNGGRLSRAKVQSPSFLEHISEYQRANRVRALSKDPMRVMVVEDDPINRVILKKKLTQNGHSVSLTVHGQEAVELFEKDYHQIDIILMDLQMPICDGMEATRRIRDFEKRIEIKLPRSHISNRGVPIIAVSASLHEKQRGEIQEAGMDGWILKPVDFNRLSTLMISAVDLSLRAEEVYKPGTWDKGGWLGMPRRYSKSGGKKRSPTKKASQTN